MADSYYVIGPDDLSEKGKTSRSGVITLFAKRLCEKKGLMILIKHLLSSKNL